MLHRFPRFDALGIDEVGGVLAEGGELADGVRLGLLDEVRLQRVQPLDGEVPLGPIEADQCEPRGGERDAPFVNRGAEERTQRWQFFASQ